MVAALGTTSNVTALDWPTRSCPSCVQEAAAMLEMVAARTGGAGWMRASDSSAAKDAAACLKIVPCRTRPSCQSVGRRQLIVARKTSVRVTPAAMSDSVPVTVLLAKVPPAVPSVLQVLPVTVPLSRIELAT